MGSLTRFILKYALNLPPNMFSEIDTSFSQTLLVRMLSQ